MPLGAWACNAYPGSSFETCSTSPTRRLGSTLTWSRAGLVLSHFDMEATPAPEIVVKPFAPADFHSSHSVPSIAGTSIEPPSKPTVNRATDDSDIAGRGQFGRAGPASNSTIVGEVWLLPRPASRFSAWPKLCKSQSASAEHAGT